MKAFPRVCAIAAVLLSLPCDLVAGQILVTATDMTPTAPLSNPTPTAHQPRYISGLGSGDSFTLFFEDRDADYTISYVSTTTGPTGLSASATPTNISDTHFCVKDWPINIDGTEYAYRAWGAVGNVREHNFYVSSDLVNWTLVSTFTIPNFEDFHSGYVYYGFHDVIELNGTYYAWGECNIGYTLMCRSDNGADDWEAFARVGGLSTLSNVGPLGLPDVGTPTGSFFELGGDRGYGKIMVPGNDSAFYLAINTTAKPSLPAAELEAAFIDPANWTWHDGITGLATVPILTATSEHDLRECWLVPNGGMDWTILYDADYGGTDGGKALGYATLSAPLPCTPVSIEGLSAEPLVVQIGCVVGLEASIADGCGQIDALWDFDDETVYSQTNIIGPLISSEHTYSAPGVYTVVLTVSDNIVDAVDSVVVVAYDPDGGFVTGGGWFWSPAGAYLPDVALEGKASFGFVSKYKKGVSEPSGQTEFVFKTADLYFHSTGYDWLVVTGSDYARFKGAGTINGWPEPYKFMLWAGDGEPDTFTIKIWEENESSGAEMPIYQNPEDQPIDGGSIVVQVKK